MDSISSLKQTEKITWPTSCPLPEPSSRNQVLPLQTTVSHSDTLILSHLVLIPKKHSDTAALCYLPCQKGKDKKFYFIYPVCWFASCRCPVQFQPILLGTWKTTLLTSRNAPCFFVEIFLPREKVKGLLCKKCEFSGKK